MSITHTTNYQAREYSLQQAGTITMHPTSLIEYQSRGRIAVIGGLEALEFAPRLIDPLHPQVVLLEGQEEPGVPMVAAAGRPVQIEGYMGSFKILLGEEGKPNYESLAVDLILDLGPEPLLSMPVKPPGYFYCSTDEEKLTEIIETLSELTGVFEKPKFFDYDATICAHGRNGIEGCSRCLDACPAQAITDLLESIQVNPNLCQGGGVCASVCPTGAIRYSYPEPVSTLERLSQMIRSYSDEGGQEPVVCFIPEAGAIPVNELPDNYLPVYVEELASIGLEVWLSAISFGASSILLIDDGAIPEMVVNPLQEQLETAWAILSGLGYPQTVLRFIKLNELDDVQVTSMPSIQPASYRVSNDKRQMAYFAIDHLYHQLDQAAEVLALPASSPFGRIIVNKDSCTLCLACTSLCPANAVKAGGESPKLIFQELNCVQCGICARGCPEQAITLEPRLITDPEKRLASITLYEEQPFHCISCGKPFATQAVINTMIEKLQGHWMYQSERSRQRLKMCEDCRVVDAMQDSDAMEATINVGQIGPNAH